MNVVFTSVLAIGALLSDVPTETNWNRNYGETLQVARESHRPLLILIVDGAIENGAQKSLPQLKSTELADLLSEYEVCRVDANTKYGAKVAKAYRATQFPYIAISDARCEQIVYRRIGQLEEKRWTTLLREHRVGLPTDQLVTKKSARSRSATQLFGHANMESALVAAREQNRQVLAFITTDGCHHCEKMKTEIRNDPTAESIIKEQYESVIINQTSDPTLIAEQGVRIYPTTLVFSQEGQLTDRINGYSSPAELLDRIHNKHRKPEKLQLQ